MNIELKIELVPFTKNHVIPANGYYLVKTKSTSPLKSERFLQARCTTNGNTTSVDVNNQIVTHISVKPLFTTN